MDLHDSLRGGVTVKEYREVVMHQGFWGVGDLFRMQQVGRMGARAHLRSWLGCKGSSVGVAVEGKG